MDAWNALRRRTVENATMLCAFTETPEAPRENKMITRPGNWKLPLERERQLAEDFAFISSYRHSSDEVTALCLEEGIDGRSMNIRVAANAGDLGRIVQNLQAVADIMVTAVPRDMSAGAVVERLLSQIVSMDRQRILTRLRSKHAPRSIKTVGKPALPVLLTQAVCSASSSKGAPKEKAVQEQCQELRRSFDRLEKAGTELHQDRLLCEIVRLCHDFPVADLVSFLAGQKLLDPSLNFYLPEAIRKVGRYAEIANNLINAARGSKYQVFHQITVSAVSFKQINAHTFRTNIESFDKTLARLNISTNLPKSKRQALNTIRQNHTSLAWKLHDKGKVHAEIQLLFFYSTSKATRRCPRIICSSKSACYLCFLFLNQHGTFSIPRTHGRIYHKWSLPAYQHEHSAAFADMSRAAKRMNSVMEGKIKAFASLPSGMPRLAPPNESVLGLGRVWSSTSTLVPVPQALSSINEVLPGPSNGRAVDLAFTQGNRHVQRHELSVPTPPHSASSLCLASITGASFSVATGDNALVHAKALGLDVFFSHESPEEHCVETEREDRPVRVTVKIVEEHHGSDADAFPVHVGALPEGCDTVIPVGPAMEKNLMRFVSRFGTVEVCMEYRDA